MTVTLITPTGMRQNCFNLCENWIKNQTFKGDIQWIVVDDGPFPTKCTMGQEYYRGPRLWEKGLNTQRFNMELAISKAKGDDILIIEDDDWYGPTYIEMMVDLLKHVSAVGHSYALYYHFPQMSWKEMGNKMSASLCQTGVKKSHLHYLKNAVNSGDLFFDIVFWRNVVLDNVKHLLVSYANNSIGMKGLPGRQGIGSGHRPEGFLRDEGYVKLQRIIGKEGLESYKKLFAVPTKPVIKSSVKDINKKV